MAAYQRTNEKELMPQIAFQCADPTSQRVRCRNEDFVHVGHVWVYWPIHR